MTAYFHVCKIIVTVFFSCIQYFFMYTVFFHVYSIFSRLQDFFLFTVFFPVYRIFSCLQYFLVNTICQTFHSNRLLCYSLLDKDSVLDSFTTLVTKQFSQTFHSNWLLCYGLLLYNSLLENNRLLCYSLLLDNIHIVIKPNTKTIEVCKLIHLWSFKYPSFHFICEPNDGI